MPDADGEPKRGLRGRQITFGLREAVVLALVAVAIACLVVYYEVT